MRALSAQHFFALAATNHGSWSARTNRGEMALAFGIRRRLAGGRFLDLDAVAAILVDELTPGFGRKFAAVIVTSFGDAWLNAVGQADATQTPVFFQVGEEGDVLTKAERGVMGKDVPLLRKSVRVGCGTIAELAKCAEGAPAMPERLTMVNITSMLARVRARAAGVGLDLSAPFFPPPDDPFAKQLIATAKQDREAAVAMYFEAVVAERAGNSPQVSTRAQ